MSGILTIMKKEFARFFGDRRMLIMILLPGVLIYVVYSFMGSGIKSMVAPDEDYVPSVYVLNIPQSVKSLLPAGAINIDASQLEDIKARIANKTADLCVVFPADFDALVDAYDAQTKMPAPRVDIYYNSANKNSSSPYAMMTSALDAYESSLANKFDVNPGGEGYDMATAEDTSASILSSMMPMLLMIFLFSGAMGIAPESISGEKERGTIATLLVTPLKRSHLAIGKILSLGVLAFLSGLVSTVAMILALPKLMGGADESISMNPNIYGVSDYLCLALIIVSTILLFVTLISIISAFAKTVKEASTAVIPLMIIVMLVGVTGMFSGGAKTETFYYLIPAYNSVQSMNGIFSLDYSAANIAVSCVSNLVYACIGGFVLTKMFNSERVMFSK